MKAKWISLTVVVMASLGSFGAFGKDFSKATPELIEKGKAAYKTNCLSCHGEKGDGNGPAGMYLKPKPRAFKGETFKNGDKPEDLFKTLADGMPGTAMVSFKHLPEEVRWALVHYVLQLRKN